MSALCIPFSLRAAPGCSYIHPGFCPAIPAAAPSGGCADDEMDSVTSEAFFHEQPDIISRIIAGIQTEQERPVCDLLGEPEHIRKEGRRVFLPICWRKPKGMSSVLSAGREALQSGDWRMKRMRKL